MGLQQRTPRDPGCSETENGRPWTPWWSIDRPGGRLRRERVAGLERLSEELKHERDAWKDQASRHEVAARELRILVQQAQALARALPAESDIEAVSRSQGVHGVTSAPSERSGLEVVHEPSHVVGWLRRLLGKAGS